MNPLIMQDLVKAIEADRARAARRPSLAHRSLRRAVGDALIVWGERLGGSSVSVSPRSAARARASGA